MTIGIAPGKIILVGEHAVVYGRPAIAAPVWEMTAQATVTDAAPGSGCTIIAHDTDLSFSLATAPDDQPLALVTRLTLAALGIEAIPDWCINLHSDIPIASGMGSGAALSTALVRSIFAHVGQTVAPERVSSLVFESERLYHGAPSGIDNTVIAHGVPIWFVKGETPQPFTSPHPFTVVIADSGVGSPTKETVGAVRRAWQADPLTYDRWFDEIASLVRNARCAIEAGDWLTLGSIFDCNHELLMRLDVSAPLLDRLIDAARRAGALGAKLSGGGRGGNVIALVAPDDAGRVARAFRAAGATCAIQTTIA
jgi:mevalonate kinase